MRVLGLNISGFISSAALVENGEILAAAAQERFSRLKRDRTFPVAAIEYCLTDCGMEVSDLDAVAIGWNPGRNLDRDLRLLNEANRLRAKYLTYVPNALALAFPGEPGTETVQEILGHRLVYVDHHLAHAASACLTSSFDHAAFVTIDAFGEEDTLTVGTFADGRFDVQDRVRFPHSLGAFYSYFTEFLGFRADQDEYKVMALGAYANPDLGQLIFKRASNLYRIGSRDDRLFFELDLARFDHYMFHRKWDFGPLSEVLEVRPRLPTEPLEDVHFAVAWALQACFESIVATVLHHAQAVTGEKRIALSGGSFMNSVANGRLTLPGGAFEEVFIPPYPDDSGTAIGAALYVALEGRGRAHLDYRNNFFGPEVTAVEAEEAIRRRKIKYRRVEDPAATIAELVASGEIVAHAAGKMEFGQRALGHRSIFADPRDPEARNKVNRDVKRREPFRPYAASVLADRVHEVFDCDEAFHSNFMEKVRTVTDAWAEKIPGVLHADRSVRLHTVDPSVNPLTYAIVNAFETRTGVPLVLNTSFNVMGMPIVCSADDALDCFFASGLDSLVLCDLLVRKEADGEAVT